MFSATRSGTGKSGWCLTKRHADCRYDKCTCNCHPRNEGKGEPEER